MITETSFDLNQIISTVARTVPPLWDLPNFVAVNPFVGESERSFRDVAVEVRDNWGRSILPSRRFFQNEWDEGRLSEHDIEVVASRMELNGAELVAALADGDPFPVRSHGDEMTYAQWSDACNGTAWERRLARFVSRWLAADVLGASGCSGIYSRWLQAARQDLSLEIVGLAGWRKWVTSLPTDPADVLAMAATSSKDPVAYLKRLVGCNFGWACALRRSSWETQKPYDPDFAEFLSILAACDLGIANLVSLPKGDTRISYQVNVDESALLCLQEAREDRYTSTLISHFRLAKDPSKRADVQALFCIDVRSEILRRHLEAISDGIQTHGFAGFFGVSLDWGHDGGSSNRCPVLLKPQHRLRDSGFFDRQAGAMVEKTLQSPPSAFALVENLGLGHLWNLVGDTLRRRTTQSSDEQTSQLKLDDDQSGFGIPLEDRIALAQGIIKYSSLGRSMAPLVLLCGHGSLSENNPHAAGLECGACGGHGGALNARVASRILNDPQVRIALGEAVPEDTFFLAGLHNTATDDVMILDQDLIPLERHGELVELKSLLLKASAATRAERAPALGIAPQDDESLLKALRLRAHDYSEVRTEWALARNASFVAARRSRTRGVNLAGRAFLHEYDWELDSDGSVLELVLTAPMVVASWINLQYFASTVDNDFFGSGPKVLQNRLGTQGVILGNDGDLRTGLSWESVADSNGNWFHDPLRLQVVVESPLDRLDQALESHPSVRNLVENGWVRLLALDPVSDRCWLRCQGRWSEFPA